MSEDDPGAGGKQASPARAGVPPIVREEATVQRRGSAGSAGPPDGPTKRRRRTRS